ncbi:LicD family-domain-containing protein [Aspergillus californicus]
MRSLTQPFLLALYGLLSVQAESDFNATDFNATDFNSTDFDSTDFNSTDFNSTSFNSTDFNTTFEDVREHIPKVYSGQEPLSGSKYFKESSFHYHYDGRFANETLPEEDTLPHLSALIQTYLSMMADLGAETWIMHGSLLAWWWNQKIFPWDNDLDVQISEPIITFLAEYYNMTEHHFDIPEVEGGRTYLLEINPNYVIRSKMDKANVIDGRWIDTSSGLFIDITAVRTDDARRASGNPGALMCKDRHNFDESDIFPLRNSYFEDVPAKIPYAYSKLLQDEYGAKALSNTKYQGHQFDEQTSIWQKIQNSKLMVRFRSVPKIPVRTTSLHRLYRG